MSRMPVSASAVLSGRETIPDTITASQWRDQNVRTRDVGGRITGELELMCAVLECAVADLGKGGCGPSTARAWFASEDREWPYSFLNIAEALDVPADKLRRALGVRRRVDYRHDDWEVRVLAGPTEGGE